MHLVIKPLHLHRGVLSWYKSDATKKNEQHSERGKYMPPDRVRHKTTNYTEIYGEKMRKNASIMRKHTGLCGNFNSKQNW